MSVKNEAVDVSPKLETSIAGIRFQNPVMNASGTFGNSGEYSQVINLKDLGAIVTKGVSMVPWEGNGTPRVAETPSGMMNAIGLQNPGVEAFLDRDLPVLRGFGTKIIVNICGHSIEEYEAVSERLSEIEGIDMLEVNVSCPNVKEGGIAFGTDPGKLSLVTRSIRKRTKKPIILKLSPNVTSIADMARAAESEGADAVSLINTFTAMKIDIRQRKFFLANGTGGLSGPAIHPIAVRMVYEAAHAVKLPIIGMGGIASGADAIEMMMAGASAVAVGMMQFSRPSILIDVKNQIRDFLIDEGIGDIREIIGIL
ncbi:MAG: dihydroorotate dehydrogenase [Lachnospiraceae bacterium]|nr:dihydroorotate dehydrogenase [Lachnospiraceae bacterium]